MWYCGVLLRRAGRHFRATSNKRPNLLELVLELNSTRDLPSIDVSDHGVRLRFALRLIRPHGLGYPRLCFEPAVI